ncbi:MAG: multidrug effflux MFS transporter [Hyphomicrobiaceae bacterium]
MPSRPSFAESVALLAMMMCLVALSIDAMLPALPEIAADLGASGPNSAQFVITALLFGLSLGQLIYGPISDTFGRRGPILVGLVLFGFGSLLSMVASDYETMLIGRFLQGFGAAGPRVVTAALVRDQYSGPNMARMMSFIMTVFIVVPALAPALGQGLLMVGSWRTIYASFLVLAVVAVVWFMLRQPETLPVSKRHPFKLSRITSAMGECIAHPVSRNYAIAAGLVFGSFVGFLTSVQQIFATIYGIGDWFPLYFGMLAVMIGTASLVNARIVVRLGMQKLAATALCGILALATAGLVVMWATQSNPTLIMLMAMLLPVFFCFGILFGNFNALAMEPMGHIAGTAAAAIASITSLIAAVFGTLIGQSFDGTVVPLFSGFVVATGVGLVILISTERWRGSHARAQA